MSPDLTDCPGCLVSWGWKISGTDWRLSDWILTERIIDVKRVPGSVRLAGADKTQIKFISDLQQHENISQLRPDLQTTNLAFYPGDLAVSKVWLIYPFMIITLL